MLETNTIVSVMAGHLVVGTEGIGIMAWRKYFGWFAGFKWLDGVLFKELFVDCCQGKRELVEISRLPGWLGCYLVNGLDFGWLGV